MADNTKRTTEEKARKAAEAIANYDDRFNSVDVKLSRIDAKLNVLLAVTFLAVIAPSIKDLLQ